MDGRLNCKLTADNAAHAKLRHLENRVAETEAQLNNVEQQVANLDDTLQDALIGLEEKVETENVDTNTLSADTIEASTVISNNVKTLDIETTAIDADVIDVASIDVDALQGRTADVETVIAAIANVTETNSITANASTINTETLNVEGGASLTGTTTVDGDIIFTKDTGLSKLEGNYLDIEASNITIENKLDDTRPALLVKDVDSLVEFEGKLKVHNDVEVEKLTVNKETYLSEATLDNPTFDNIADTQRVSTRCLDIDDNGKLVRLNIGEASDAVVTALVARDENDLERVNISADGAYFTEPVELNGETKIVSERVGDSKVLRATIADANITNGTVNTLTATDAALDNITTNLLNGKKLYENEWYDAIITNSEEFAVFLVNTNIKYPKIMITRDIATDYFESEYFTPVNISYPEIYRPKGTNYKLEIYTSSFYKFQGTFTLHNLDVDIRTDAYQRMGSENYLQRLFFDNCNITMDMTPYASNVESVDIMPLYLQNLKDSTLNFTPAAPADCKWQYMFYPGCKNSTINAANVEGQTTLLVNFGTAENCKLTAYNITEDFNITTNSEALNTFIDKDNIIKQVDISTLKAVYNQIYGYDAIIFRKNDLYSYIKTVPLAQRRRILYLNRKALLLDTADVTTDPGTIGQTDVYLANRNVVISNTGTTTSYFTDILSSITWQDANIEVEANNVNANSMLANLKLTDGYLTIEEDPTISYNVLYLKNLKNSIVYVNGSNNLTFSLDYCERVKTYIRDLDTLSTIFFSRTYDSFVDVNADVSLTENTYFQYGPGSNMLQIGTNTKQIIELPLRPAQG